MGRLKDIVRVFWDAFFPRSCVVCKEEGDMLCTSCAALVRIPAWHVHAEREGVRVFSRVSYKERAVQRLLHAWKYQGDSFAGVWWQAWIAEDDALLSIFRDVVFVPVPLAREAFAERGFNQAEKLAQALAQTHNGQVLQLLERSPRKAQAKTDKAHRGDMRTQNPYHLSDAGKTLQRRPTSLERSTFPERQTFFKRVVLVDDVYTTGSTIMACADVLKQAGVQEIFACTLAYGNDA